MSSIGKSNLVILSITIIFTISSLSIFPVLGQSTLIDLNGRKIALYYGDASSSTSSRIALQSMFSWMNATVDILSASDINYGNLAGYNMVVIPGGWAGTYNVELAGTGISEIRNFVRNGGAFFGVCAGAYFGCDRIVWEGETLEYQMDLFEGSGIGPVEEIATWPNYAMAEIILNHSSSIIDFSGEPSNHSIMYYGGPWFNVTGVEGIHSLATYAANNESAMIAFEYEEGRVFLSGPHPEWEEDSNRDNSSWENGFDDEGSEWNMMLSVALWLFEDSSMTTDTTSTPNNTVPATTTFETFLVIIGVFGTAFVLLYIARKRMK
ncbi:MAG: BPL-N domain-containing protein [Candidatus Thorarchaeota archaeon]